MDRFPCQPSVAVAALGLVLLAVDAATGATAITDESELAAFAATERGSAVVSSRVLLTRNHELGEHHHLAVECGAGFDGSGGGRLKMAGALARTPAGADYQVVYSYVVGDYQDSPADRGPVLLPTLYAPPRPPVPVVVAGRGGDKPGPLSLCLT